MSTPLLYDDARRSENNLNIMRLLLAVMVLSSHSFLLLDGNNRRELMMRFSHNQNSQGGIAVYAFFAISGFLITQSYLYSRSMSEYLKKRVLRIYPGFLATCIFCAVIIGPMGAANTAAYWHALLAMKRSWLLNTLLLNNPPSPPVFMTLPAANYVNGSLWTIRYEFWCYLLIAAMGVFGWVRKRAVVLSLFVFVFAVHAVQVYYIERHGNSFETVVGIFHGRVLPFLGLLDVWPRLLVFFLAGSVCFLYREIIPRSPRLLAGCFVVMTLTCVLGGFNYILPFCGSYALLYAGLSQPERGKWITRYGDFSYGVYLYAYPIQQTLLLYFGSRLNSFTFFVLALLLTLPFAMLSWRFIEKPALKLKPAKATAPSQNALS